MKHYPGGGDLGERGGWEWGEGHRDWDVLYERRRKIKKHIPVPFLHSDYSERFSGSLDEVIF